MSPEGPGDAPPGDLAARLNVMVLTHPEPACGRSLGQVVAECLEAGATAIQLRDKEAGARTLSETATRLLALTRAAGALLIVNDRIDVALSMGADGVHLGPDDLPVYAARRIAPSEFVIGYSTDDLGRARSEAAAGADYMGVGAVYGTRSKPGLEAESIGPEHVRTVREASGVPCVGIGGITPANAAPVFAAGAGVAVLSTVMSSDHPGEIVRQLVALANA